MFSFKFAWDVEYKILFFSLEYEYPDKYLRVNNNSFVNKFFSEDIYFYDIYFKNPL